MVLKAMPLFLCLAVFLVGCKVKNHNDSLGVETAISQFSVPDSIGDQSLFDWMRSLKKESQYYRSQQKSDSALLLLDSCISNLWRSPETNNEIKELGWVFTNRAYIHEQLLGNYLLAKRDYLSALAQFEKCQYEDANVAAYVLHPLGNIHTRFGENEQAIGMLNRCKNIALKSQQTDFLLNAYNDLGRAYMNKGDQNSAINYFKEGILLANNMPFYAGLFHTGLAESYSLMEELSAGVNAASKGLDYLKMAIKTIPVEDYRLDLAKKYHIGSQIILGRLLVKKGNYKLAENFLNNALEASRMIYGDKHRKISKIYLGLADAYSMSERLEKAILSCQMALVSVIPNFGANDFNVNPVKSDLVPDVSVGEGLIGKARNLVKLYHTNRDTALLRLSLKTYQSYFEWENLLRAEQQNVRSKLQFASEIHQIGEEVLDVLYEIQTIYPEEKHARLAFSIIDQTKGILLSESDKRLLNGIGNKHFDSISQILNAQKTQLLLHQFKLGQLNEKMDSSERDKITRQIELLDHDHQLTLHHVRKMYPNYGKIIYRDNGFQISDTLSKLSVKYDTDLLNYFVGDSSMFLACIQNGKFGFQKIDVHSFREKMRSFLFEFHMNKASSPQSFHQTSHTLYKLLLKDFEGKSRTKNWLVLPDRELNKLPFETLIKDHRATTSFKTLDYLVLDHHICYAPSSHIILNFNDSKKERASFLGIAPVFKTDTEYDYLGESASEIKLAANYYDGTVLVDTMATKSAFLQQIKNYKIVHVSSHAGTDTSELNYGWMAFSRTENEDNLLLTPELFKLKISTNLLVLNACQTGNGQFFDGEGTLSLARGFLEAGAHNIITNLWQANHTINKEIFDSFYTSLVNKKNRKHPTKYIFQELF